MKFLKRRTVVRCCTSSTSPCAFRSLEALVSLNTIHNRLHLATHLRNGQRSGYVSTGGKLQHRVTHHSCDTDNLCSAKGGVKCNSTDNVDDVTRTLTDDAVCRKNGSRDVLKDIQAHVGVTGSVYRFHGGNKFRVLSLSVDQATQNLKRLRVVLVLTEHNLKGRGVTIFRLTLPGQQKASRSCRIPHILLLLVLIGDVNDDIDSLGPVLGTSLV